MDNILITGVGSYLPNKIILNDSLPSELNTSDEWIRKRTGITQRHIVSENELTSTMAIEASKKALINAIEGFFDFKIILLKALPINAKSTKFLESHSMLAPKSNIAVSPFLVGK